MSKCPVPSLRPMPPHTSFLCIALLTCGTVVNAQDSAAATAPQANTKPDWLEGTGQDMQIRISGEVIDEDGNPATDCHVEALFETRVGTRNLNAKLAGNRYSFSIPVGTGRWFRVHVRATSGDRQKTAHKPILKFEIRQAAVQGVDLKLQPTQRSVAVTVLHGANKVANAVVSATLMSGVEVESVTDDSGVATLRLMNSDRIQQLTARTSDFRVGGFGFHRDPPRDPAGAEFTIELDKCRPQKIRLINVEDETPIPDLEFAFIVGTGPPNYQFHGKTPDSLLKSDENGEAIHHWFPDWEQHGSYANISNPHWVKAGKFEMVDGVMVIPFRKSKFAERKRVRGKINSEVIGPAGFYVQMNSFQGEEKGSVEVLDAFTDEVGVFEALFLPGATYWICVNDVRYVSDVIDMIPCNAETEQVNKPELTISEGQPIEVIATSGSSKQPIPFQGVNLSTTHSFTWMEEGVEKLGIGSRRWFVTTNKFGRAFTYALAGQDIEGAIYSPTWRSKESVKVEDGQLTRLKFHRRIDGPRKVVGRLILPEGSNVALADATVTVGSVDGETDEESVSVTTKPDGTFEFESAAFRIGLFARSRDSTLAAVAVFEGLYEPLEVRLQPTTDFDGQLLTDDDKPLKSHRVRAILRIEGESYFNHISPVAFNAYTFETTTDEDGNYTLKGLPFGGEIRLFADPVDGSERDKSLRRLELKPGEKWDRQIDRLLVPSDK